MNWLNIEVKWLRSSEYLGSEPVERATWLSLMAYCADQENGGVIKDCRDWSDRRWQQTCGVTKEEAMLEAELWNWFGNDLKPWKYPVQKEAEIIAKRKAGAKGGRKSKPPETKAVKAVLEADGKESGNGIGIGKERNTPHSPPKGGQSESPKPKRMTQTQKKLSRVDENTPLMVRIGSWFGRKEKTLWSILEAEALAMINPSDEDVCEMENRYTSGDEYLRRDLITLLNNWQGELDKARRHSPPVKSYSAMKDGTRIDGGIVIGGKLTTLRKA